MRKTMDTVNKACLLVTALCAGRLVLPTFALVSGKVSSDVSQISVIMLCVCTALLCVMTVLFFWKGVITPEKNHTGTASWSPVPAFIWLILQEVPALFVIKGFSGDMSDKVGVPSLVAIIAIAIFSVSSLLWKLDEKRSRNP